MRGLFYEGAREPIRADLTGISVNGSDGLAETGRKVEGFLIPLFPVVAGFAVGKSWDGR